MNELRAALGVEAARQLTLQRLDLIPRNRLHVHYIATSSTNEQLVLTLVPSSSKLLRLENTSLKSEAELLQWLCNTRLNLQTVEERRTPNEAAKPPQDHHKNDRLFEHGLKFKNTLPRVMKHGQAKFPNHVAFLLTKRPDSSVISSLSRPLSKAQRKCVDFQIGQLIRELSAYQSPIEQFGVASAVLESCNMHHNTVKATKEPHNETADSNVFACWSDAFYLLLESVLRDAEDVTLSLEYEKIRLHASRFRHILDEVTVPCLVILDAGENSNTCIVLPGNSGARDFRGSLQRQDKPNVESEKSQNTTVVSSATSQTATKFEDPESTLKAVPATNAIQESQDIPQVVGIQDWYNSVFGDVLFTSVLTRDHNPDVWDGLIHQSCDIEPKAVKQAMQLAHDFRHANVRRLLYDCYHSIASIVTEYYRVAVDGDDRELPARRRLIQAIARLDDLDDIGRKIHARPSLATSAAKRQRPT
ncbi:hypothetical protein VFPPC_14352 [Pochonia chlamydosporia 170]|uniref:Uncharacterized protein n=1 Tax=Pochonia chlamydosporia 170 TaxID=1380566 RepID=A0A179FLX5_METCM|nr:hypothetical protein VFPPC_14352 [Pochonia chlamydosporia 170]OAQ66635.1 hypothetical protein VFPPC_14352 [Pochonia chlamydosporia 170]